MEDPSIVIPKLPNDVIIEILTRLPVKPLLKFKCVCKSWRALISSTQFVAAHLEFTKSAPNLTTHRLILKYRGNTMKQCSVNSILHQSVPEAFDLSCSLLSERYRVGCNRDLSEVIVQVYSLKNDKWKRIENFKGRWSMDGTATFANGKLYWIANQGYELESVAITRVGRSVGGVVARAVQPYGERGCVDHGRGRRGLDEVATIPYTDDFLKNTYKSALYVLKDGRVLLLCGSSFVIFDAKDCSFRYLEVGDSGELVRVGAYLESLVSPVG
ncbi:hypothetical protein SASPL_109439 [Salvia splendens]|uniref:F-box domain-containing protein n=1 Tax=Salvia splendens TaxID=180675 RepID=A0A8X8YJZ5_SALSN|nr:hypothetical protein SASPL_109439 [Salvia splendens]